MTTIVESCFPFPMPMAVFGTSFFFCLQAEMCPPFHQLADIYVVLFQDLLHVLHCIFVRKYGSVRHINISCKQIIDVCKI